MDTPFPVVTVSQARAVGISGRRLRADSDFVRLHRGVYADATNGLPLPTRAAAALATSPSGSYLSHHTAAELLGYWAPTESPVHVSVPRGARRHAVDGIVRHQAPPSPAVRQARGLPVAGPMQCVRDLARVLTLVELVVLLDSVCVRERVTVGELAVSLGVGSRRIRRAFPLVSELSESPSESRLRVLVHLGGMPKPTPQHVVRDPVTGKTYRLDLAFPELRVAVEYDGRQHADDPRQYAHDIERRNALQRLGWTDVIVVAQSLYNSPGRVLDEVAAAIGARTGRRPAIDPRWRGHFAQRRA